MTEPTFCTAETEIEIDGEAQTLNCTQRFGHLEDHSAKVWWAADPAPGDVSGVAATPDKPDEEQR